MYKNHGTIRPIENPLFHVQPAPGNSGIYIQQLDGIPDYRREIIDAWQQSRVPSSTHNTLHGQERGKRSYEVDVKDIKAEYISIIEREVNKAGTYFNYEGRKATINARQILLYEPGEGCVVHADDQDSAEVQYGIGACVFNWANQLIALMFISTQDEDYHGGELFVAPDTYVKGVHGKLILMPGHFQYKHGVAPIIDGYRLAVQTTWRFDL